MTPTRETNYSAKLAESGKNGLDPADRAGEREKKKGERSSLQANAPAGGSDEEGRNRDQRKEETNGDERRPKREREDSPEKKRPRERRFREVKERESPKERDFSRERSWRPQSDRGRDERSKSHREQGREKGSVRGGNRGGRGSFSGANRQGGSFATSQGRYNSSGDRDSRKGNWGKDRYYGGHRDSSSRKQPTSYHSKGEKWKHDMFETVVDADRNQSEEDPIAKIEALLAS